MYRKALGERHPEYGRSLNNLATVLGLQGDYAAARPLFREALEVYEGLPGGNRHPEYAQTLNNLGALLESQGDYAAARPLFRKPWHFARPCWVSVTPSTPRL